jgi:hypothetical protein
VARSAGDRVDEFASDGVAETGEIASVTRRHRLLAPSPKSSMMRRDRKRQSAADMRF